MRRNLASKKKYWIYWLKVIVALLLLFVIFKEVSRRESIVSAFSGARWHFIVLAFSLFFINISIAFSKWRYLLKTKFQNIANREVLGSLLFGITLGLTTPGNLGELARGLFFPGRNKSAITGLTVFDKLCNIFVLIIIGFASLILMSRYQLNLPPFAFRSLTLLGLLSILALFIIILNPGVVQKFLEKYGNRLPLQKQLKDGVLAVEQVSLKEKLVVVFFTASWFAVIILQYHFLVLAFTEVTVSQSAQAVSATLFGKAMLPLTFADLGIREGMAIFFFSQFGVSHAAVFNASLIIFLINFIFPGLIGFYYVLQLKTNHEYFPGKASPVMEKQSQQ